MITSLNRLQANTQTIVRFNRIKLCKPGTRFQDHSSDGESCLNNAPPLSCQLEAASYPVGENLELVDTNDATTVQPARFR